MPTKRTSIERSYAELFLDLGKQILAQRQSFAKRRKKEPSDDATIRANAKFRRTYSLLPPPTRRQIQSYAEQLSLEEELASVRPSVIAAARLTLHAIRRGAIRIGEIIDAEKLLAPEMDETGVVQFWNQDVLPVIRRYFAEKFTNPGSSYAGDCIAACECLASLVDLPDPKSDAENTTDFQPFDWWRRNTTVPGPRLRQATRKGRRTKHIRSKLVDGVKFYCVSDGKRVWPDEMFPPGLPQ